eukprot:TRINITY_DN5607_c0_g1_i2.p3 TRINITY_DN5607_c0_g1~~TRINITY_DN5607_c0_g1_i2.p3  ORF type:complete len:137 (-),score=23.93 TRINITY_DN5607_c0_g1_i2:41-451(-)
MALDLLSGVSATSLGVGAWIRGEVAEAALALADGAVLFLLFVVFWFRRVEIHEDRVSLITLFPIPFSFSMASIEGARIPESCSDLLCDLLMLKLSSSRTQRVILDRRGCVRHRVLVSPDDPELFVATVNAALAGQI